MNIITEEKTTICTSTQEEAQQIYEVHTHTYHILSITLRAIPG